MSDIGRELGIDYIYIVKATDKVHAQGGKALYFVMYSGGLPAPGASNNRLGYGLSWSCRGVLIALHNSGRHWQDGKVGPLANSGGGNDGSELMKSTMPYFICPGHSFVAFANRDLIYYKEGYDIPKAQAVIRSTLQY